MDAKWNTNNRYACYAMCAVGGDVCGVTVLFLEVEHVKNEVSLLSMIAHPAIVNM